jgi:hypothetical protein
MNTAWRLEPDFRTLHAGVRCCVASYRLANYTGGLAPKRASFSPVLVSPAPLMEETGAVL